MTNTKNTKRALLSSVLALFLCFAMLIGSTFAWFTDSAASAVNKIVTGNLDVELYHTNRTDTDETVSATTTLFDEVDLWEPGAMVWEKFTVKNLGELALKYTLTVNVSDVSVVNGESLADVLKVAVMDVQPTRENIASAATQELATFALKSDAILAAETGVDEHYVAICWEPSANDNDYNFADEALYANLGVTLLATQATVESDSFDNQYDVNSEYPVINKVDTWDGTADTSWYNDTDTEFTLSTAEALAGFAELVDAGNTFEGKTILLGSDLDLDAKDSNGEAICFEPIGSYRNDTPFKGTFDGQGNSIKNLSQNTWALDNGYYYGDLGLGLFGKVEDASIKNLVMDGANISGESGLCGTVAGAAYGDCTFDNITVKNSKTNDYQYYAGGVVGWASGNHVYTNINIDASTTIGSQWGDFGNATGGIIGGSGTSAEILFKDCTVACRIDATNDIVSAYQWWCYRNSGMLIGRTGHTETSDAVTNVAAPNVTCENVTVIYGDWANYTYCEFAGTGYPYVRVQAGVSVDAYSNVRYGHPTDANGNTVVDDNHVHNDGEDHHLLIVFDQLFGGGAEQHYCQYGIATHPGVTVVYNNK